ncbi:sugar phosphate isomerase/epimerase family protein [Yeosuana sp. MJ-SS3]|uniref:Sugar phosphate isomerase/epimerase family protein n=1 Tax=Gilvirhabdus luticola TaxID=3079858 RepID=A0ABU3U9Q5_9FLAO|nr:sugar phosphate isomerase/epimerase family protein [Yeosuana sp. MJ-SS3]MDU8887147.1 sugar phosphate isomerase/epimerase family protein [Yeosuana sp. MJ-SS3]
MKLKTKSDLVYLGIFLLLIGTVSCKNDNKKEEKSEIKTESVMADEPFYKLSLAQWSLHKAIRDEKTLSNLDFAKKAKELGFEGIEYVSQLYPLTKGNEKASLDSLVVQLKKRSEEHGIQNVLIMVDGEGDLAVSDKAGRDEAIRRHSMWIDAAAELGCSSVRVNLSGGEAENIEQWQANAVDGLGRLAAYGATININVIVENHGGRSSEADKLVAILKEINLPNCGTLPDFGNFCIIGSSSNQWKTPCDKAYDRYKGMAELLPFAKGVSAKSYTFDENGNEETIDYYKMMKIVKDSDYKGFIGVEYEGSVLSEEEGILATKALVIKAAENL